MSPEARTDPDSSLDYNFTPKWHLETIKSPACTFFKRFKEKHYPKDGEPCDVDSLLVSKIKYNLERLN